MPKIVWGTLQRFIKTGSSKNFMQKRGVQRFSVESFSLTVPKNFAGEHFWASEIFLYRKKLRIRRGRHVSPSGIVCPKLSQNIVGDPSVFQNCSGIKIFFWIIGVSQFCRIFFVSYRQKSSWANTSVFQKYSLFKIFWIRGV